MEKTQIKAEIVADSLSPQGERLTSLLITFPRIILAEVNTHRMLSKNTSSSRAIPFKKMVESVQNDPFIPIAWQKHHSGMQGSEYFTGVDEVSMLNTEWLRARDKAVEYSEYLNQRGLTKQLCNRLLEPFMWTTMLITGSKEGWNNFFELRCPSYQIDLPISNDRGADWKTFNFKSKKELKREVYSDEIDNYNDLEWFEINKGQAEIHIMDLAEKIYDAMNESKPKQLKENQWHIPFGDKLQDVGLGSGMHVQSISHQLETITTRKVKVSTAMAARTSYTVVGDEKEIDYEKMIGLHDRLLAQDPPHSSPMEHCARTMSDEEYYSSIKGSFLQEFEIDADGFIDISTHVNNSNSFGWCRNFKGFIQYRHLIETKTL